MRMNHSIVEYFGENVGSHCGYCKSSNTNCSNGMWAHTLSVEDYQALIDRGWRRSGCYCYKPIMDVTCCPPYAVRCAASEFNISRSQKKIIKRFNRYIIGDESKELSIQLQGQGDGCGVEKWSPQERAKSDCGEEPSCAIKQKISGDVIPSTPQQKKAKLLRKERKRMKLLDKGLTEEEADAEVTPRAPQVKSLEEFINEIESPSCAHVLDIRLVQTSPASGDFQDTLQEGYKLYRKYQMAVHEDPPEECSLLHYRRFLVDSPLQPWKPQNDPPHGYGSFHQQYWLDGKLIAVGVIDILPRCVSSVYFYYDPDLAFLSLGTYGALREIAMVRSLNLQAPSIEFYYMGYYIHSCPKMRYKANYKPSYLLCPETYSWHRIEECHPKLDQQKYSRLNPDLKACDVDGNVNLDAVAILYKRVSMLYGQYKKFRPGNREQEVLHYAQLVGQLMSRSILLYRADG